MARTPPAADPSDSTPELPADPAATPWKGVAPAATPWKGVEPLDTSWHGGSLRDRLQLLTDRAEAIARMLAAVPEDVQSAVDGRTREALSGYVQGLRDAVRELGQD
ncbi:hypothetical protein [Arthrobacter sp. ISL-65]|uniref:hypothetical protein n=1 Tax=Arthrobacter sp. ISL-65 TaxID=2819112 RepID=UPI001BE92CC4|nr:hypothetical protein [Arthrobacter sp. ISL-65]MBT2549805.1 hypothetical protein [Arthrobacter sp. ISL-65]